MPLASTEHVDSVVAALDANLSRADDLLRKHLHAAGVGLDVIGDVLAMHRIERKVSLRRSVLAGLAEFDAVMEADVFEDY